jgi:hypothetical protein
MGCQRRVIKADLPLWKRECIMMSDDKIEEAVV